MAEILSLISGNSIARDVLCCMVIGLFVVCLRQTAWFDGRLMCFVSDFVTVGVLLILLQAYAAGHSACGELRWYMILSAVCTFVCIESLLFPWRRKMLTRLRKKRVVRAEKQQKNADMRPEMRKKQLPNNSYVLYNSNV